MYDVIIIGAGVVGCAVARELSRLRLDVAVLEAGHDVAVGTTKANSAIVHSGCDAKPGTLKAATNVRGNAMFAEWARELEFPFRQNGSLILCFDAESLPKLDEILERGRANGVPDLRVVDRAGLEELEPGVGREAIAALYAPTGGITCPYEMTVALAENAAANGVEFHFGQRVSGVVKLADGFAVDTPAGGFKSRVVVNAAGVFADEINNMVSSRKLTIVARAGQYCLFDKTAGCLARQTLFQLPTKMGKGVLVSPTVDGNLIVGPTAVDLDDKSDVSTHRDLQELVLRVAAQSVENLPARDIITVFTGLRAHCSEDDFVIGEAADVSGFFNLAGIESPGLTAAPAIAVMAAEMVGGRLAARPNPDFVPRRPAIPKFREMDAEERSRAIAGNPAYGKVVCRCENVTEAEVLEAVRRHPGARDLDGVKRRVRAGMGRCQGGFCSPQILAILSRELGMPWEQVSKFGGESRLLVGKNKMV